MRMCQKRGHIKLEWRSVGENSLHKGTTVPSFLEEYFMHLKSLPCTKEVGEAMHIIKLQHRIVLFNRVAMNSELSVGADADGARSCAECVMACQKCEGRRERRVEG